MVDAAGIELQGRYGVFDGNTLTWAISCLERKVGIASFGCFHVVIRPQMNLYRRESLVPRCQWRLQIGH